MRIRDNAVALSRVRSLLDPSHAFLLRFQPYRLNQMGRWLGWEADTDGWLDSSQ